MKVSIDKIENMLYFHSHRTFTIGEYDALCTAEEIVRALETFIKDRDEVKLITSMAEISRCPDSDIDCPQEPDPLKRCILCWAKELAEDPNDNNPEHPLTKFIESQFNEKEST